jgi:hypothetical protein
VGSEVYLIVRNKWIWGLGKEVLIRDSPIEQVKQIYCWLKSYCCFIVVDLSHEWIINHMSEISITWVNHQSHEWDIYHMSESSITMSESSITMSESSITWVRYLSHEWIIWLAEKGHNRIYHIIIYSWHKVTRMWPLMRFPQISPSRYISKGE